MFGWLGRKAVLYLLLVAAIGLATVGMPWLKQAFIGTRNAEARTIALEAAQDRLTMERARAQQLLDRRAAALEDASVSELERRIAALRDEQARLETELRAAPPRWRLALRGADAVIAVERTRLRLAVVRQELPVTVAARDAVASRGRALAAVADMQAQRAAWRRALSICADADRTLRAYEATWSGRIARWWETDAHKRLARARDERCAAADRAGRRLRALIAVTEARTAARRSAESVLSRAARDTARLDAVGAGLAAGVARAQTEWQGQPGQKLKLWADRIRLPVLLRQAAFALALIIAMPLLIRLFCYFVLAPAAMRRASIRLRVPGGTGRAISLADRSATSVPVRLEPGEELLVRQDYLQTSSHAGAKDTQWLLDWRHPLTSIATGLTFLTRIRGDGQVTTVSAVRDALAEVTVLALLDGASCVLQPRALAAVAQPIARPLRVTTHWRLGSLNAWLTLQLRYIVFHGPVRLVVKGGRGVRVERAERGRVFGQDQLVGFSADLAYSVTRTETFWPYFLGRESLLKDRVEAGEGVLIVEEAPLSAHNGEVRRGLEGLVDAGMKMFGM